MAETDQVTITQALARSRLYLLLATAFRYPDSRVKAALLESPLLDDAEAAATLLSAEEQSVLRPLLTALRAAVRGATPEALEEGFVQSLGHLESGECPPYETRYGPGHIFQQTQEISDIAGFYRAFGLQMAEAAVERPDHIAIEFEFLHFLTYKEAYALRHHGEESAEICRTGQRTFLREHPGRWVPLFARLLARRAGGGFYAALADLAVLWVATECRRLGVTPPLIQDGELRQTDLEPEGAGFTCGAGECGARELDDLTGSREQPAL
ncbi:MAG: molecular chaperone TorD family protein [Deltaproteobacteria bacterium]|nr:molecular chaperone TorD family protein [Deltaproteobacteria bacterium]